MAEDKKDDAAAAAAPAPAKDDKKAKKPKKPKDLRFSEAGWNTFGSVLLAGFAFAVFGMGQASLFEPGLATVMTLTGGIVIFGLSGLFAKMAVTEFGKALTKAQAAATPAADSDGGEKDAPKGKR